MKGATDGRASFGESGNVGTTGSCGVDRSEHVSSRHRHHIGLRSTHCFRPRRHARAPRRALKPSHVPSGRKDFVDRSVLSRTRPRAGETVLPGSLLPFVRVPKSRGRVKDAVLLSRELPIYLASSSEIKRLALSAASPLASCSGVGTVPTGIALDWSGRGHLNHSTDV